MAITETLDKKGTKNEFKVLGERNSYMFPIYIYHPQEQILHWMKKEIENYIIMKNFYMKVKKIFYRMEEVCCCLQEGTEVSMYFIYNAKCQTGLHLACEIRKYNPWSFLIFLVSDAEGVKRTILQNYQFHLMALDCISLQKKETASKKIRSCIDYVWLQSIKSEKSVNPILCATTSDGIVRIFLKEIYYMESSDKAKWVVVHLQNQRIQIHTTLKELENRLDSSFFKCHKSFIVNIDHIKAVSRKKRMIYMQNEEILYCGNKKVGKLQKKIKELTHFTQVR